MCELMCDVKWIQLLISKVQKSQNVGVVLITSENMPKVVKRTSKNIILCSFIAVYLMLSNYVWFKSWEGSRRFSNFK